MIFLSMKNEAVVQVGDKTRLDGTGLFSPDDENITLIEIQPSAGDSFYDVTSKKYLDWQYSASGDSVITLRVTGDVSGAVSATFDLTAVTSAEDNLFSSDADLLAYEDDILKYVRKGRNSFLDKHRKARDLILAELDANRIWKDNGDKYTAADVYKYEEFNKWSSFLTLKLICESLSNETGDLWDQKQQKYDSMVTGQKKRASYKLDSDGDGTLEVDEVEDVYSMRACRR